MAGGLQLPSPRNYAVRPLDKGIVLERAAQLIPDGAFVDIKNFIAGPLGLQRTPGDTLYAQGSLPNRRFLDLVTLWKTSGSQTTFLITDDFLYKVGVLTGFELVPWAETTGTLTIDGITVTGTGTSWETDGVKVGDWIEVAETNDIVQIDFVADSAGSLGGTYFILDADYYVWFDVGGVSVDPAPAGLTGIEVDISSGDTATAVATAADTAIDAVTETAVDIYTTERVTDSVWVKRNDSTSMATAADEDSGVTITYQASITGYSDEREIVILTDDTNLTMATILPTAEYLRLTEYRIKRSFESKKPYLTDYTIADNELIIASAENPLAVYDDTSEIMTEYIDNSSYYINQSGGGEAFYCTTVTTFLDRVFVGNLIEPTDGERRQRIRWSLATNKRDFSDATAYIDLPYVSGAIQRLISLGNVLVVYFEDAVFFGSESLIQNLPVTFDQIETGNVGLVGQKAVVSWMNSHFFVGQDDIYMLNNRGIEKIGTPVVRHTLDECKRPWRIYAAIDTIRERICFGFPKENDYIEEIWSYSYKSGCWSYDTIQTWMIANPLVNLNLTIDDLTGTIDGLSAVFATIDDMEYEDPRRNLYIERSTQLYKVSDIGAYYSDDQPISAVFETKDFDFDSPDQIKTITRLSAKIDYNTAPTEDIVFTVEGSVDKGRTWRSLRTLTIKEGFDEGYTNFRLTGSTIRFRLTSSSEVTSYYITEFVMRVAMRGSELTTGFQS